VALLWALPVLTGATRGTAVGTACTDRGYTWHCAADTACTDRDYTWHCCGHCLYLQGLHVALLWALPVLTGATRGTVLRALSVLTGATHGTVLWALPVLTGATHGTVLWALPVLTGATRGSVKCRTTLLTALFLLQLRWGLKIRGFRRDGQKTAWVKTAW